MRNPKLHSSEIAALRHREDVVPECRRRNVDLEREAARVLVQSQRARRGASQQLRRVVIDERENVLALLQRVSGTRPADRLGEASVDLGWRAERRGVADKAATLCADARRTRDVDIIARAMSRRAVQAGSSGHHAKLSGCLNAMSSVIAPRSCTLPMLNALSE